MFMTHQAQDCERSEMLQLGNIYTHINYVASKKVMRLIISTEAQIEA